MTSFRVAQMGDNNNTHLGVVEPIRLTHTLLTRGDKRPTNHDGLAPG